MDKLSKILSFLFFPLFMPLYGILMLFSLNIFSYYPIRLEHIAIIFTVIYTLILPLASLYFMKRFGIISDMHIYKREDRPIPMYFFGGFYLFYSYELFRCSMPMFVVNIAVGAAIAIIICGIVSHWWKISGHATGIGGIVSAIIVVGYATYTNTSVALSIFIFAAGLVATARLHLKKHSLGQIAAGFINGFLTVQIISLLNLKRIFEFFI